jgi:hypothetical protein
MNLFNFISLVPCLRSSLVNVKWEKQTIYSSCLLNKKNFTLNTKIIHVKSNLNKVHNSYHLLLATESVYRFTEINGNKPNLFKQLINKYWQQTMFLSYSTPLSKKYIIHLAKKDTLVLKSQYKKNLINFSKALLSGRIDSQVFLDSKNSILPYVQYIWKKGYNIGLPPLWNKTWFNNELNKFFHNKEIALIKVLKHNKFPVFIVVNGFNQMVIAEPGEELAARPSSIYSLYKWYSDHFLLKKYNNKMYEGWFFVNPYDAVEYKDYIRNEYIRSSQHNGLNIMPASIDFYYRLNRQTTSNVHFRLLPDFLEVSKLVKLRSYRKDLIFHPKQKYGKSYFQGQPIYLIQSINNLASKKNYTKTVNYFYRLPNDPLNKKYNPIFFNKDVALVAWANFRKQMPLMKLPEKPILMVYNLEDFLKDYEHDLGLKIHHEQFLLVPSKEVYKEISKNSEDFIKQNWLERLYNNCYPYLLTCTVWSKRAIWSLISRQPPN